MITPSLAVLGGSGLVLSRFVELYPKSIVSSPDISELNITDYEQVLGWSKKLPVGSSVILGAAYTDVNGAEKEKGNNLGLVYKVNVLGPRNVSLACKQCGLFLIHISTDFVFTGTDDNKGPYREDQKVVLDKQNIGWYGQTKLMGEQEVLVSGAAAAILRISYPFRAHYKLKTDFARNILSLYDQRKLYPMFSDQYLTPTFVDETAEVIGKIGEQKLQGIFHCAANNVTTPHIFAKLLLEKARGVQDVVQPSSLIDFRKKFLDKAPRPQYGGLDSQKTQERLGVRFVTWEEQIEKLIEQINSSKAGQDAAS